MSVQVYSRVQQGQPAVAGSRGLKKTDKIQLRLEGLYAACMLNVRIPVGLLGIICQNVSYKVGKFNN